jgi:hypothetical protein
VHRVIGRRYPVSWKRVCRPAWVCFPADDPEADLLLPVLGAVFHRARFASGKLQKFISRHPLIAKKRAAYVNILVSFLEPVLNLAFSRPRFPIGSNDHEKSKRSSVRFTAIQKPVITLQPELVIVAGMLQIRA